MEDVITKETSKDETQEKSVTTQIPANYIVIWYHNEEYEFLVKLDRHLQLLYRRLGSHIVPYYFGYPKSMPEPPQAYKGANTYLKNCYEEAKTKYEKEIGAYQEGYRNALQALRSAILFIPCTSVSFLEKLWRDMNHDPALRDILQMPPFQIMHLPIRATQMLSAQGGTPLCAYEGYRLDIACVQIVQTIETIIRTIQPDVFAQPQPSPFEALFPSPTTPQPTLPSVSSEAALTERYLAMLSPMQVLLEQATQQVAEAQRIALSERSQRITAEEAIQIERQRTQKQLEEIQQQIAQIQQQQHAGFFAAWNLLIKKDKRNASH